MSSETISIHQQNIHIRKSTTLQTYSEFVSGHFQESDMPREILKNKPAQSNDYFRLLTAQGLEIAQYGFSQLDGQLNRHRRKGWEKAPTNPEHITAVLVYMADLNMQAKEIKQSFIDIVNPSQEELPKIWATPLTVQDGNITTTVETFTREPLQRLGKAHLPYVVPNYQVSEVLVASLGDFTGEQADEISSEEFEKVVFPELRTIYNAPVDRTLPLFTGN